MFSLNFFSTNKKNIFFYPPNVEFPCILPWNFLRNFFLLGFCWLTPKKCTSSALHQTKTCLYRNAWDMSFSLIQEAEGFSLTTQFIDSKKIVSVTPQNPKFSPKTNLEVGCEVRDRLLEVFIKIAVFCRTWFLKILVNF